MAVAEPVEAPRVSAFCSETVMFNRPWLAVAAGAVLLKVTLSFPFTSTITPWQGAMAACEVVDRMTEPSSFSV
jgi:hypothetical protein